MRVAGLPLRGHGDRPLYTFCRWLVLAVFAGLYRCRAEGTEHLPATGPALVAVNHKAEFDPMVVGIVFDRPFAYMAKRELFKVPVLGRLISALGAFPIDRGAGDRAALQTALDLLADGHVLLMFPEGTRQPDDEIHEFLPGVALLALRSGAPVVPVAVHGTEPHTPQRSPRVAGAARQGGAAGRSLRHRGQGQRGLPRGRAPDARRRDPPVRRAAPRAPWMTGTTH